MLSDLASRVSQMGFGDYSMGQCRKKAALRLKRLKLRPKTECASVDLCQAAERLKEATKDAPQGCQRLLLGYAIEHCFKHVSVFGTNVHSY